MTPSRSDKHKILSLALLVVGLILLTSGILWKNAYAQAVPPQKPFTTPITTEKETTEVINPYFSIEHRSLSDGTQISGYIINGPSTPPNGFTTQRTASILSTVNAITLSSFPSFNWVFGCSSVSGAMIAAYYDRTGYPNMYTGPTNGGVMPQTDTSWSTWSDGIQWYPNNPLIASHSGVDGRTLPGSVDDYWVSYLSSAKDPYLTNGRAQHAWGDSIGDYMKTSQSSYGNVDGSTSFYNYPANNKLTCSAMEGYSIADNDGTYGRKLFYEARGYTVTDCYNQNTDNNYAGGFLLANFQAEIDAGTPVLMNLAGHSIVGYGYSGSTIYIRDTWDSNPDHTYTMQWGGMYSGMQLLSVSVVHPVAPVHITKSYLPALNRASATILNGDFEQGPVFWEQFSTHGWPVIVQEFPGSVMPYSGTWAVWLGGDYNDTSYIQQSVQVPTSYPYLSFKSWIASADTCGHDFGTVLVNGTVVAQYDLCTTNNTSGWIQKTIALHAYAGTSVTLQFRSECDATLNSNLFIDQVAFQSGSIASIPISTTAPDTAASDLKLEVMAK